MPSSDPWLWTVDKLIAEVCHSKELYKAAGYSATLTPDAATLEKRLRNRQLTGKTFLSTLDHSSLVDRNELNIPRPSQRVALMSVVDLLRHRSYMYKQRATTTGVGSLDINSAGYSSPGRPTGISNHIASTYEAGSNQRRITHLSTAPSPNVPSDSVAPSITAATGPSQLVVSHTDEYSHLLEWQNAVGGDQIVEFPDEDDLEDDDNSGLGDAAEEDPQMAEDQQDDAVEESNKRTKLSQDEIVEIINERIEFYTNAWRPNKGAARGEEVDYNLDVMWNEAEAKGEREALAQKYEKDHNYLSQRLDRLCDEIVNFPGSNAEQVRRQCSNLEVTIDSMELAAWLRGIYKLEPVDDSDEEHVLEDQDMASTRDQSRLQQNKSTPQAEPAYEIIDLGSPSEPSDVDDGNASPFDNDTGAVADPIEDKLDVRTRSSTRDLVIVDSVEPNIYVHPGRLEPDGGLPSRLPVNHGDEPENASIATVRRWKWEDLVEHLDRKRVVSKTIHEMKPNEREVIRSRIQLVGKTGLIKEIRACIDMLCKGETKLQGILPRDMPKILTFTKLFLSWWFCRRYSHGPEASERDLEELKECMDSGAAETTTFYDYVYTIMGTTFSVQALQQPDQPSQAEIIEISDDD